MSEPKQIEEHEPEKLRNDDTRLVVFIIDESDSMQGDNWHTAALKVKKLQEEIR